MEAADHMPPRSDKDKLRIVRPPEEPGRGYSLAPAPADPAADPPRLDEDGVAVPRPPAQPQGEPRGLECRSCGCRHFRVLYTRARRNGIMRRRQCMNAHCGREITTYERTESA